MIDRNFKIILYLTILTGVMSLTHALFPLSVFILIPLLVGIIFDFRERYLFSGKFLTILGVAGFFIFLILALKFPFEAIGYLLLYLSMLRSLGEKRLREYKQFFALSFFGLVASSIFHYSMIFLVYVVLYTILATLTLITLSIVHDSGGKILSEVFYQKLIKFTLIFDLVAVLASVPFFIILPRSPYVIFKAPAYLRNEIETFGDEISLGEIATDYGLDRVVMRVKPLAGEKRDVIYIRGNVYDRFDGFTWKRSSGKEVSWKKLGKIEFVKKGRTSGKYLITLNPVESEVLYTVDFPHTVFPEKINAFPDWGRVIKFGGGRTLNILKYRSFSIDEYLEEKIDSSVFLEIPSSVSSLMDSLVLSLRFSSSDPHKVARAIGNFLRSNFEYSMQVPGYRDPVRDFVKERKGYCEHFATLDALLLRKAEIPARIVVGFRTSEWNPYGEYYVVRLKDAHSWVEYYDGKRWVRFDPTPAAEERKGFVRFSQYWDYIVYLWNTRVLEFSYMEQVKIFLGLREKLRNIRLSRTMLGKYIPWVLLPISGVILLFLIFRLKRIHPATRYWYRFERFMRKKGMKLRKGETPLEFAKRVNDRLITEFVNAYYSARFGNDDLKRLKQLWRIIRKTF